MKCERERCSVRAYRRGIAREKKREGREKLAGIERGIESLCFREGKRERTREMSYVTFMNCVLNTWPSAAHKSHRASY